MSPIGTEHPQKLAASFSADTLEANRASARPPVPSGPKTPLLPDLSTSTREILARVQAGSTRTTAGGASSPAYASKASATSVGMSSTLRALAPNTHATPQFPRPTMGSGIFDKSKLKSAFASALIPKSKTLPSQPVKNTNTASSSIAPVSPSPNSASRPEKPPQTAVEPKKLAAAPAASSAKRDESTIEVRPSSAKSTEGITSAAQPSTSKPDAEKTETPKPDAEKTETPKSRTKTNHTYVLPSGEIVNSGKGLGRGRPGIKRGPRKPKSTTTLSETKPASRKRKRSLAESDIEHDRPSHSPPHSVSDSGDEYAPQATQTRSGRHTQRPANFVPPESPSNKKSRLESSGDTGAGTGKVPVKRRAYRGREQSALCEHCLRGYGPLKNAIVFCDGCNRCWHQRCHDPMIARKLVLDPSSEWFCNECTAINEKARARKAVRVQKQAESDDAAAALAEEPTVATAPLSSTDVLSARKDYLNSLPKEKLVDLLMQASGLISDQALSELLPSPTPLAPPPPPPRVQPTVQTPHPAPSSAKEDAYPTPTNELSDGVGDGDRDKEEDEVDNNGDDNGDDNDNDNDDFEYEDEHKKLYPKPGNGVPLPPESEDLEMLLEGPDCGTFSHRLGEGVGIGIATGTG